MLIPIKVYAAKYGRTDSAMRKLIERGLLKTAVKIGSCWAVDENEPYPADLRRGTRTPEEQRSAMYEAQKRYRERKKVKANAD